MVLKNVFDHIDLLQWTDDVILSLGTYIKLQSLFSLFSLTLRVNSSRKWIFGFSQFSSDCSLALRGRLHSFYSYSYISYFICYWFIIRFAMNSKWILNFIENNLFSVLMLIVPITWHANHAKTTIVSGENIEDKRVVTNLLYPMEEVAQRIWRREKRIIFIKGDGANFSFGQLSSIDIIQPYAKPTNVWLLLISCLYIIVQPVVRI